MTRRETIEQKAEQMIEPVLREYGCSLVDVEYVKEAGTYYLRFYMDKEGGVTILDCEQVSRRMSALLDEDDFIDEAYTLEVSSPGLGRALKKDKDFVRNLNKPVELKLFKAEEDIKEFVGELKAFDKESVTLNDGEADFTFQRKNIALIREYVDWDA